MRRPGITEFMSAMIKEGLRIVTVKTLDRSIPMRNPVKTAVGDLPAGQPQSGRWSSLRPGRLRNPPQPEVRVAVGERFVLADKAIDYLNVCAPVAKPS